MTYLPAVDPVTSTQCFRSVSPDGLCGDDDVDVVPAGGEDV